MALPPLGQLCRGGRLNLIAGQNKRQSRRAAQVRLRRWIFPRQRLCNYRVCASLENTACQVVASLHAITAKSKEWARPYWHSLIPTPWRFTGRYWRFVWHARRGPDRRPRPHTCTGGRGAGAGRSEDMFTFRCCNVCSVLSGAFRFYGAYQSCDLTWR